MDANQYYVTQINTLKQQIRTEKAIQLKRNSGIGFLTFSDKRVVKDVLYDKNFFPALYQKKLSQGAINRLNMHNWKFNQAYSESDIIWGDISKDKLTSTVKTLVLWVLLFIISVILLTPMMLINIGTDVVASLDVNIPFVSDTTVSTYVATAMTVFLNIILIPFFIDVMVLIENHPSKSSR